MAIPEPTVWLACMLGQWAIFCITCTFGYNTCAFVICELKSIIILLLLFLVPATLFGPPVEHMSRVERPVIFNDDGEKIIEMF